jgi:hypothetical protein
MNKPTLFIELCAGSAAVTLGLVGGSSCNPPVSYQGSKRGYRKAILAAMGLRQGLGAEQVVLVEAGPWADVWANLIDPEKCKAVANVIRGWIGEDARALWDRLRAEAVPPDSVEGSAGWLWLSGEAYRPGQVESGLYVRTNGNQNISTEEITAGIDRLSSLRFPPTAILKGDVAAWGPVEVARYLWLQARSVQACATWHDGQDWQMPKPFRRGVQALCQRGNGDGSTTGLILPESLADRVRSYDKLTEQGLAIFKGNVQDLETVPPLPQGTFVYMDPPYQGCTGYVFDMSRAQVLEVARKWSDAGAVVCVSEAEPLHLPGWHHLEITGARHGQARTFSKQKREWLTMNREPAVRPMVQAGLFEEAIA